MSRDKELSYKTSESDKDSVKLMKQLLSRDLTPKKPGPKCPREKGKSNNQTAAPCST